jgi:hypothetical protein
VQVIHSASSLLLRGWIVMAAKIFDMPRFVLAPHQYSVRIIWQSLLSI